MKITGELLKAERLKKNLTVQDVAQSLKLSSKIINSIEAGQTENLPAKTFIRGFVKSYAQYLKIDVDQVMNQFQEEMGSTHPLPKNPPPLVQQPQTTQDNPNKIESSHQQKSSLSVSSAGSLNKDSSKKSLFYIGIASFLILIIVIVNKIIDRYQKETVLDPSQISQLSALQDNTLNSNSALSNSDNELAKKTAASSENANNDNIQNNTNGKKETVSSASDNKQNSPTTTQDAKQQASNLATEDGFEPSSGKPVEIIVEAKKEIEISYAKGNSKVFSKLKLSPKQVQVIRSSSGLHLKTEDGSAVHLVVNGIDKGQAGGHNKAVKLTF